jgi:hypothetical protein
VSGFGARKVAATETPRVMEVRAYNIWVTRELWIHDPGAPSRTHFSVRLQTGHSSHPRSRAAVASAVTSGELTGKVPTLQGAGAPDRMKVRTGFWS